MVEQENKEKEDKAKDAGAGHGQEGRTVKEGDVACVNYTGKLDTGEVFDTSEGREPLEFVVGSGQLIKGFDTAVVGMKKGDKKDVDLEPADAYGDRDESRIQPVERKMLPKEPEPKEGMMLIMSTPTGQKIPAKIEKVEKDVVMIDFNHPLAGKKLNFEIELVDVKDNKEDKEKGEQSSGCSSCSSCGK